MESDCLTLPVACLPAEQPAHMPFIGRSHEIDALTEALAGHRLVSITGPAGVGKSRLACHVAALAGKSGSVVGYVDMSAIPALSRCGCPGEYELLVLDNGEEHVSELARLVPEWLGAHPDLRILLTTQIPLGIQAEYRVALPPLGLTPADGIGHSEAAQLFLACCAAWQVDSPPIAAAPSTAEASLIDSLCRLLDGLPLALALAAELVGVVPLDQVEQRIRTDLQLLATEKSDLPAHQRRLWEAAARSCSLLTPDARVLFRRVAAFEARFTVTDAEAVCADDLLPVGRVLPLLRELATKSMIQVEPHQGTPRYRLLLGPRLHGRACLAASGEAASIRDRHAAWFLEVTERVAASKDKSRRAALELVYPEVLAALEMALEKGDGAMAQRFCTSLSGYWSSRGRIPEGFKLMGRALALPNPSAFHQIKALATAGSMAGDLGDLTSCETQLREAAARWRELPDLAELARTLMNIGVTLRRQGRYDEAQAAYQEALSYQEGLPDQDDLILTHLNLGVLLGTRGRRPEAAVQFEAALATARRHGNQWGAATALSQLAQVAIEDERLDDAVACQTEALVLFRGLEDQLGVAVTLVSLAGVSQAQGAYGQALAYYRESIALTMSMRRTSMLLDTFDQLMQTLQALKQSEVVARLLGFCDAARQQEGIVRPPRLVPKAQALTEACMQALGGTWFGSLYRAGALMTLEQAMKVATADMAPIFPKAQSEAAPAQDVPAPSAAHGLSPREVQILQLLAQGLSSREIGERLFLSVRTVEKHLERLRQRLGIPNKARLVAWALQVGLAQQT